MASPIIKIKRGSLKPANYNLTGGNQTGLTAGELGVLLDATNSRYAFYIGSTAGVAITFGCEVTTDTAWTSASDFKIPTQAAIKTYIQNLGGSPPGTSSVEIISRSFIASDGGLNGITANPGAVVKFGQSEFSTPAGGISSLAYSALTGTFTYSGTTTINVLITYQITWAVPTTALTYNLVDAVRSAWIQKNPSGIGTPNTEMYGYNTLIIPPQQSGIVGSVSGTMNGSAIIQLAQNDTFQIQCRTHGSQAFVRTLSVVNAGSGSTTNFNKATNIQIAKI